MREVISTTDAPPSIGPFSQAIRANGFVYVSGQVALDPSTRTVIEGDISAQTERTIENVAAILRAAGSGLDKVVSARVFLIDMNEFSAMNAVYSRYFASEPPARTTIEVSRLPLDVRVEIDVVALA